MKEDGRGSSLPQHSETSEGGCLIKIEHLGPRCLRYERPFEDYAHTAWCHYDRRALAPGQRIVGSMENAVVSYLEQTLRTIPVNIGQCRRKEPGKVHENNLLQLGKRETLRT